ncbi:MAG: MerR family DNA-binding protein [Sphingobium sp.]|nr:MerR family DNA-binding protein [Sphingobium sp.]
MAGLTVSELARAGGVGVETVRYYQRQGLMPRPPQLGRSGAGIRHYGERDVHRLNFIRGAQAAGFSLKEIARLLQLEESDDRAEVRLVARQRVAALDEEIAQLTRARDALERLAGQCERTKQGPCPVLNAFDPR